jgi:GrpB-like predicted nucleotidyltransferase (UPF0157 family)
MMGGNDANALLGVSHGDQMTTAQDMLHSLRQRNHSIQPAALGERALRIEHVGSTSVPGLAAKPVIDILLVVGDSSDERSYVPALEAAGFVLRIREPDWHEHRLFQGPEINLNLHVFSVGSTEIERLLLLRDRLREDPAERQLYDQTKRELASRTWKFVQEYADAKSEVIEAIINRAQAQMISRRAGESPRPLSNNR